MLTNVLLWAAPALIIPLSYLSYRYVPFRKFRYFSYAVMLVAGFFMNLFLVSFRNGVLDTAFYLAINFMLLELAWHILRIPAKKIMAVLLVIVLGGFCAIHMKWLASGPSAGTKLWKPVVTGNYRCKFGDYRIEEREIVDRKKNFKTLTLTRGLGFPGLEKEIRSYRVPDGFFHLTFIHKWSETDRGVRLDLFYDTYTVWTLGEGF